METLVQRGFWRARRAIQNVKIALLGRWIPAGEHNFLFAKGSIVGRFLATHPVLVFLSLSISCASIILLPAWKLNLLSIWVHFPNCSAWHNQTQANSLTNVGILHKPNWSFTYAVLIPFIFSLAAVVSRSVRRTLVQLVEDGTVQPDPINAGNSSDLAAVDAKFTSSAEDGRVTLVASDGEPISTSKAGDADLFVEVISEKMRSWDVIVFRGSVLVALLACVGAGYGNVLMYLRVFASRRLSDWYDPCLWDDLDWMHGWTIPGHQGSWFHMIANFVFYLATQIIQGFVIFLASYFVFNFLSLTQFFATVIIEEGSGFHFEPFISDPDRCLGLRPMGRLFSIFLVLSIVFQLFAFGLRLQQILLKQGLSVYSYFSTVASDVTDLGKGAAFTDRAMKDLLHRSGFDTLNPGLMVVLVLMIIPMSVIAWWPIVRLRNYVAYVRQKELRVFRAEEQLARQTQKYDTAKHIADDIDKLTKASIWPNGFKVGWGSFFFLFALLFSTIAPPLIVPLVSGGVGLKILKKFTSD